MALMLAVAILCTWFQRTFNRRAVMNNMNRISILNGILLTGCFIAMVMLMPGTAIAQANSGVERSMAGVVKSMADLKAMAAKLGTPRLEGEEMVGGKNAPTLYFGSTKISNNFALIDAFTKQYGEVESATFFVKSGDEYIRVTTNIQKPDGGGRAVGTVLDPAGKAIVEIKQGKPFYGEVTIQGTPYITGYEPIKDAKGNIIGIYLVGYHK
jgi:hypothetical protein